MTEQEERQDAAVDGPLEFKEMAHGGTVGYWKQVAKDAIDCSNKFRKEAATYKRALAEVGNSARIEGIDHGKYKERFARLQDRALPQAKDIVDAVLSGKIEINITVRKNSDGRKNENQRNDYQWGDEDDD